MAEESFHLIDLATQFEELERFLRGSSLEEKERWIASQGDLRRIAEDGGRWAFPVYCFTSRVGLRWPFGIDGEKIVVFGDHHVLARKKP
jgi:hypothetical protein